MTAPEQDPHEEPQGPPEALDEDNPQVPEALDEDNDGDLLEPEPPDLDDETEVST